jgi:2-polyprenyl-6-methoxyphenol hydroxylase-like FAD-dependent oxidoreductase
MEGALVTEVEALRRNTKEKAREIMNQRSDIIQFQGDKQRNGRFRTGRRDRALVMGGSMAGLVAARALSDYFDEVVIVERDRFPKVGDQRRGVPQGWHAHGLLASGLNTLEHFFPGLFQEAIKAGGLHIDAVRDAHWWLGEGEHARCESGLDTLCISRPLLEGIVRERVRAIPNIRIIDDCQVQGLTTTPNNERVTGIKLTDDALQAALVVDATGRGSRSPLRLEAMGYGEPMEEKIEINLAYVTRRFRRSPHHLNGALLAVIAAAPEGRKGGVMVAQEGDSWIVSLYGYCGMPVPTELSGFIEFAKALPASHIYDVISRAEAIGDSQATRFSASLRRRYEKMDEFPEGYLVIGDAISSFNPVYGQGMSVAALEALELHKALKEGREKLSSRFFAQAARIVDIPWSIAAGNDLRFPEVNGSRTAMTRFLNWYVGRLHAGARKDQSLAMAFHKVASLLASPESLLRPRMVARVLSSALWGAQEAASTVRRPAESST